MLSNKIALSLEDGFESNWLFIRPPTRYYLTSGYFNMEKPCTNQDSRSVGEKMLDPVGIPQLGCLRR